MEEPYDLTQAEPSPCTSKSLETTSNWVPWESKPVKVGRVLVLEIVAQDKGHKNPWDHNVPKAQHCHGLALCHALHVTREQQLYGRVEGLRYCHL